MKHAQPILIISLLLSAGFAQALTLSEAVSTALQHNPEVIAAGQDVAVARTKSEQVRAQERVTVGAEASLVHLQAVPTLDIPAITLPLPAQLGGPMALSLPGFELAKENTRRLNLSLQKPLSTGGRVKYGLAQVDAAVKALDASADNKRAEIALTVVKAYLSAVLAQQVAAVNDEAYENVKKHEAQAEALFKAGMVARYELVRAQTEVVNQDRRRLDAHNQADLALAYLQDVMGVPEGTVPKLDTALTADLPLEIDYEEAVQTALQASDNMRALQARDTLYAAGAQAALAERRPVVALAASTELLKSDLPLTTPEGFIGVVARMPLLDGGMAKAKAAEQVALRERNRSDIERLQNGIRLEVRKYNLDLQSARKALEAADQAVTLANENLRLATRRFEVGEGTGIEKMDAIITLSLAETNREQARYQYEIAYYGLKKSLGQLLAEFRAPEVLP